MIKDLLYSTLVRTLVLIHLLSYVTRVSWLVVTKLTRCAYHNSVFIIKLMAPLEIKLNIFIRQWKRQVERMLSLHADLPHHTANESIYCPNQELSGSALNTAGNCLRMFFRVYPKISKQLFIIPANARRWKIGRKHSEMLRARRWVGGEKDTNWRATGKTKQQPSAGAPFFIQLSISSTLSGASSVSTALACRLLMAVIRKPFGIVGMLYRLCLVFRLPSVFSVASRNQPSILVHQRQPRMMEL